MSSTHKRRSTKNPPHQLAKQAKNKPSGVNWLRVLAIVVGLLIVLSLVLSLFLIPGANPGF